MLEFLVQKRRLSERLRDEILSWEHSGFSVDASVRIAKDEREGLRRVVRYMARPAVAVERVQYDRKSGEVTLTSAKKLNGQRPIVATYDPLTFIALLTLQVPPPGAHMVRYYGWYAARARALRRRSAAAAAATGDGTTMSAASPENAPDRLATAGVPGAKQRRQAWARLIRQVFEVDPLCCPKCGGKMHIISFITRRDQADVLTKILSHLGEPAGPERGTGPPLWLQVKDAGDRQRAHPEYFPDECVEDDLDQRPADERAAE